MIFLVLLPVSVVDTVQCVVGRRERLNHAMIRNGDGRLAPCISLFHDIFHIGDTVHIAHFRMAVQLHPPLRAVVHADGPEIGNLLHSHDGTDGQLAVKLVDRRDTFDLVKFALLDSFQNLRHLCGPGKHFHHDRVCKVRHLKDQNRLLIPDIPGFQIDELAMDDHLSHLALDLVDGDGFLLDISSVDHIRIVRTHRTIEVSAAKTAFALETALAEATFLGSLLLSSFFRSAGFCCHGFLRFRLGKALLFSACGSRQTA